MKQNEINLIIKPAITKDKNYYYKNKNKEGKKKIKIAYLPISGKPQNPQQPKKLKTL